MEIKNLISLCDVLVLVGKMLVELFGLVWEFNVEVEGIEIGLLLVEVDYIVLFVLLIDDLDLMVWFYNCFKCEGVYIVGELVVCIEFDLFDICNFG